MICSSSSKTSRCCPPSQCWAAAPTWFLPGFPALPSPSSAAPASAYNTHKICTMLLFCDQLEIKTSWLRTFFLTFSKTQLRPVTYRKRMITITSISTTSHVHPECVVVCGDGGDHVAVGELPGEGVGRQLLAAGPGLLHQLVTSPVPNAAHNKCTCIAIYKHWRNNSSLATVPACPTAHLVYFPSCTTWPGCISSRQASLSQSGPKASSSLPRRPSSSTRRLVRLWFSPTVSPSAPSLLSTACSQINYKRVNS